jgi:hypothetical protein
MSRKLHKHETTEIDLNNMQRLQANVKRRFF